MKSSCPFLSNRSPRPVQVGMYLIHDVAMLLLSDDGVGSAIDDVSVAISTHHLVVACL